MEELYQWLMVLPGPHQDAETTWEDHGPALCDDQSQQNGGL